MFPSPQTWGEDAHRADEGLLNRGPDFEMPGELITSPELSFSICMLHVRVCLHQ
jgi:hypothetical protein